MTHCRSRHGIFLSSALLLLTAIPGLCTTVTAGSSVTPNPLLVPDQTLTYLGTNNQSMTVGSGTLTVGIQQSNIVNLDSGTSVISSIISAVPEPAVYLLCGLGFVTFAGLLRKHRQDR